TPVTPTLSLHDALPISTVRQLSRRVPQRSASSRLAARRTACAPAPPPRGCPAGQPRAPKPRSKNTAGPVRPSPPRSPPCDGPHRSEEHTSELQSLTNLL